MVNGSKLDHVKEITQSSKNLKNEVKFWRKELGIERSKTIKAERKLATLENIVKELESKSVQSISCQTINYPEVPYLVTQPLPPIFGSDLCKITKPINFLSRSQPDMSTLTWVRVTEEDVVENAAEEALNEQFDRQVEDFYQEAKVQAEKIRQIYEEDAIGKLFEEDN